jgi:hypothetical protein
VGVSHLRRSELRLDPAPAFTRWANFCRANGASEGLAEPGNLRTTWPKGRFGVGRKVGKAAAGLPHSTAPSARMGGVERSCRVGAAGIGRRRGRKVDLEQGERLRSGNWAAALHIGRWTQQKMKEGTIYRAPTPEEELQG